MNEPIINKQSKQQTINLVHIPNKQSNKNKHNQKQQNNKKYIKQMSINLSRRRPMNSSIPSVNIFNNWLNNQQKKVSSIMKTKAASRTISTSLYRSLVNDPEDSYSNSNTTNKNNNSNNNNSNRLYHTGFSTTYYHNNNQNYNNHDNKNYSIYNHNRTFSSSHKNTQSRLDITKSQLTQMSQQISHLSQRAKRTRLDMKMLQKQFLIDIQQKQQQLKQQISKLNKLISYVRSQQQQKRGSIQIEVKKIKYNYDQIQQRLNSIGERITLVENSCGFVTLGDRLIR